MTTTIDAAGRRWNLLTALLCWIGASVARAAIDAPPLILEHLTTGRTVALVTGTNGKTTTTRLLSVALGRDGARVVSNETGSNMPPGHVAALAGDRRAGLAVLEVDEVYLPRVLAATRAAVVVLLNLSRDQLDRTNEVRMVAGTWRAALAAAPHATVVANADDPLVVWAAGAAACTGLGSVWALGLSSSAAQLQANPASMPPAAPLAPRPPRAAAPKPRPIAAPGARADWRPATPVAGPAPTVSSPVSHRLGVTVASASSRPAGAPRPTFSW